MIDSKSGLAFSLSERESGVFLSTTLSPNVKSDRGAQNLGAQNLRFDRGGAQK